MKVAVRYYSKNGHTQKMAAAVAREAGVKEADVWQPLEEPVDVLFLGSSVYVANLNSSVKKFLAENKDKIGMMYCFGSAAVLESTYPMVQKECEALGIPLAKEEFHCRGQLGALHKGHPDATDIANCAAFAKTILQRYEA